MSDQLTIGGVPVDLSAKTATFKMRALGSTTLKVNQAVSFKDATGNWRYDWGVNDLDTAGEYLAWLVTTTAGKDDTVKEFMIAVRDHAPGLNAYVELEEFKSTLTLTGTTFADLDIERVLVASSRAVDKIAHRRFYPDADVNQVRYYTPSGHRTLEIDDLLTLTAVVSDYDGDGTFEQTWVENTDFTLEPLNSVADGRPWETIRQHPRSSYCFSPYPRSLKVTGKFGWAAVPDGAKVATSQIAARVLTILRQAPLGVAGVGMDGIAIRVSRELPEVALALGDLIRTQVLA